MYDYPIAYRLIGLFALFVAASYLIMITGQPTLDTLIREDGLVEVVGALGFGIAAACFVVAGYFSHRFGETRLKQLAYLGLALIFFVAFGEEISWGQRLFGFGTPELLQEVNTQDEFNLHNLEYIQSNDLLNTDRLLGLFGLSFMLGLPLLTTAVDSLGRRLSLWIPIMPWRLGLLFALNYVLANLALPLLEGSALYQSSYPVKHSIVELKEAVYGLLFAITSLYLIYLLRKQSIRRQGDKAIAQ